VLIYQVQVKPDASIHDDWVAWMEEVHIPEVMATGCFTKYEMLCGQDEGNSVYVIRYFAAHRSDYEHYASEFAAKLQLSHTERYEGKFIAQRLILEELI
jgi:hypothetical protein